MVEYNFSPAEMQFMAPYEIFRPQFTHSHLDAGKFPGPTFNIKYHASEVAPYPELVKSMFDPFPQYHLEPTASREEYLNYLSNVTGLKPGFTGNDVVETMKQMPEKAVAHTILALSGITEDESHIMPLKDVSSIVDYANHLYKSGEHPWFDFVIGEDVVKKTNSEVKGKKSAPLFRKCDTFADFLREVIPVIKDYQAKDPHAFLKIFPQTKNVETFNLGINHNSNGSTTWIVEWHPGAYTPREGEDGAKGLVLKKNKAKDKEERIVRIIIEFDGDGHAVAFVKPPRDPIHPDDPPPQLQFPQQPVDVKKMFMPAKIISNHDSMASSNDPFVLLKYLATSPGFRKLLVNFDSLHKQLGYADLVLSGMIGPDTVFGMDIDFQSNKIDKSSADFIARKIRDIGTLVEPMQAEQALHKLNQSYIFSEIDRGDVLAIPKLYTDIYELLEFAEGTGYIKLDLLKSVATQLGLMPGTNLLTTRKGLDSTPDSYHVLGAILSQISEREISVIQSMLKTALQIEEIDEKITSSLKGIQQTTHDTSHIVKPLVFQTPTEHDLMIANLRLTQNTRSAISPKRVCEL